MIKVDIYDLSLGDLQALLAEMGEPKFRAKQLYRQLYVNWAESPEEMSDLSKALRSKLSEQVVFGAIEHVRVFSGDEGMTRKAVWKLPGGETIETVLMVYKDRATVCVSSQAGCPMGCVFCATAKLGFMQDLTSGQMIAQVLWAARELKGIDEHKRLSNVVYMGMGEPFNNYDPWWGSVDRLHDPNGFNLGARSFTVSTVGLIPGIERLAKESLPINLAISLHTAYDERRSALMPVNRKYPIADLIAASRAYAAETGRRVSFEYCLIKGENDSIEEANALADLLLADRFPCHINLIPWNPVSGTALERSTRDAVNAFQAELEARGVPCTIRIQRGVDIDAACGQLAGAEAAT